MGPQRTFGGQRLGREHVEARARENAGIERRHDIRVDLQFSSPRIDQVGAAERPVALELAEQHAVENPFRRRRMRQ